MERRALPVGHPITIGVLLALGWLAVVALSYVASRAALGHHVEHVAVSQAEAAYSIHARYRTWVGKRGGGYFEVSELTPPSPILADLVEEPDVYTQSGRRLTLVNAAYLSRQVMDETNTDGGAITRLISTNPIREDNRADPWEAEVLVRMEGGGVADDRHAAAALIEGQEYMRFIQGLRVRKSCLACHEQQGYKDGDVRGGISVAIPLAPIRASMAGTADALGYAHGGAAIAGCLLIGVLTLRIAGRERMLRGANRELSVARDHEIEARERAEAAHAALVDTHQKLLHADKLAAMGKLAAGVAHEINTPLGYVGTNLNALRDYSEELLELFGRLENCVVTCERAERREPLEQAIACSDLALIRKDLKNVIEESQDGIRRIRAIVQNLKTFARVDRERELARVSLNDCCLQTLAVARHELERQAEVTTDFGELPQVTCRPSEINQVVLNLVINAAQALAGRGRIDLRTGSDATGVWVEVADTGSGIPEAVQRRIFEPFYTTKPVGVGTGLGLSIAHGIATEHGGTLGFETAPGVGTTFRLWLPRVSPLDVAASVA